MVYAGHRFAEESKLGSPVDVDTGYHSVGIEALKSMMSLSAMM